MKIHEKIRLSRELKKMSQESVAFDLNLNQSQYSRRESGEIPFSADEIGKLAPILGVKVSELYGEETTVFNNHNQKGGTFGKFEHYIAVSDKIIELYEERLKEKDTIIALLKERIDSINK